MTARYYQRDASDALLLSWEENTTSLVHLGTGGGKNYIMADIIRRAYPHGHKVLLLADQDELCVQPRRHIDEVAGIIPGLEKAGSRASLEAEVVIASSQTLSNPARRNAFPRDHFTRVLIDEAHRGADRDMEIASYFRAKVGGFTATPYRADIQDLSRYYEDTCFSMPLVDPLGRNGLVDIGFAVPFRTLYVPVEIDLENVGVAMTPDGKEYKAGEAATTIGPHLRAVARILAKHAQDHFTIAFLPLIQSSKAFAALCREEGLTAYHVDGQSKDRDELIARFGAGEFQVLCNSNVLSVGVDIPIASAFLNLDPTRSMAKYQQRFGRVERVLPGVVDHLTEQHQAEERKALIAASAKPYALVFDLLWQHDRLGVIRPGHMIATSEEEANRIFEKSKKDMTPEDLRDIQLRVQEEREQRVVEELARAATKAPPQGFRADQIATILGSQKLRSYVPLGRKDLASPTQPQLNLLAKFQIDPASVPNFGTAVRLVEAVLFRAKHNLATLKQVNIIRRYEARLPEEWKTLRPELMPFGEASRHIDKLMRTKPPKKNRMEAHV